MNWSEQLDRWRDQLDEHGPDPALIAASQRIGKALAGGR